MGSLLIATAARCFQTALEEHPGEPIVAKRLAVALVGPVFVDWTAFRAAFEEQASRIIGHPVEVRGTADARFLPYPSLSFSDVVIGEDAGKPLMTVRQFNMEIELFPLLSGQFKVTEMHMVEPELNVRIARCEESAKQAHRRIDEHLGGRGGTEEDGRGSFAGKGPF